MKKMMLVILLVTVAGSSAMATTTSWTFDTNNQGWKMDGGSVAGWDSGNQAIRNEFSNRSGTLYIDGLNITVASANDFIELDSSISTVAEWCQWAGWEVVVSTAGAEYYGGIAPGGSGSGVNVVDKRFLLVGDLGLSVGDTITKIKVSSFSAGQHSMYVDNVEVSTVPEPATIGLIALGGLVGLRRRSRA